MNVYSLNFNTNFATPIMDNKVSKVVQFSFPKGKVLKKHKTSSSILVLVIMGKVRFIAEEEVLLETGQLVSLEPNVEHSVEAIEDSVMLLTLTPSPSSHTLFKPNETEHHTFPGAKESISPQLQSFVLEHNELLQVLERATNHSEMAELEGADQLIEEELTKHFRYEEDILFPLLGKYIGTENGPIAVMLSEHETIRGLHEAFHRSMLENKGNATQIIQDFLPLAEMLKTHITKEDNVLFPMASRIMSEEDKNEVEDRVKLENSK